MASIATRLHAASLARAAIEPVRGPIAEIRAVPGDAPGEAALEVRGGLAALLQPVEKQRVG